MFRGSDGKCKCLPPPVIVPVVVVPMVLVLADSPPNPAALPLNMFVVVVSPVVSSLFTITAREDPVLRPPPPPATIPLAVVVNNPSAVISHEEIMREARMYSWPAPTLRMVTRETGGAERKPQIKHTHLVENLIINAAGSSWA